ncbi:MAG TPA: MbcA/ParS/Xre antitoxin family protein [Noviherbaspirillum sp.]
MTKDGQLSPEGMEALRARFQEQSRKAQAYYTIMHRMRGVAGSDDAASAWMNAPLPALDGKTPAQLVSDGREDDVLAYIDALKPGVSG